MKMKRTILNNKCFWLKYFFPSLNNRLIDIVVDYTTLTAVKWLFFTNCIFWYNKSASNWPRKSKYRLNWTLPKEIGESLRWIYQFFGWRFLSKNKFAIHCQVGINIQRLKIFWLNKHLLVYVKKSKAITYYVNWKDDAMTYRKYKVFPKQINVFALNYVKNVYPTRTGSK